MNNIFLEKNINKLKNRFPDLANKILNANYCNDYASDFLISKTGLTVPVFKTGKALYSKYNPEKDVERMFDESEEFVLFCGLGSGLQISYFLNNFPNQHCAVIDFDINNLKTLLSRFDFSDIIMNENFFFFSPYNDNKFEEEFIQSYLPVIHGNFTLKILRPWEDFYKQKIFDFEKKIQSAIKKIKSDISTQSYFGKIWMRNIFFNLQTASKINPSLPKCDRNKMAYILGAGPSLEQALAEIKSNRNSYVLFATDTSFSVLNSVGIDSDFFISIDPQIISYSHCLKSFSKTCTGVFDLCANPITVRKFRENGNPFFFVAGGHPLAQLAGQFSDIPSLISSGGTVAITALLAAISLGFKNFKYSGLDFAYTAGKAYSRETYLSELFFKSATKLSPSETKFTNLMFRSQVKKTIINGKINYTTELLDFYKQFFDDLIQQDIKNLSSQFLWSKYQFKKFPYKQFISNLNRLAVQDKNSLKLAFLPYFVYKSKKNNKNTRDFFNLELVLYQISRYTI